MLGGYDLTFGKKLHLCFWDNEKEQSRRGFVCQQRHRQQRVSNSENNTINKHMTVTLKQLIASGMLCATLAAMGQESAAVDTVGRWTYAGCVDYAREHNIQLQQSRNDAESTLYSLEAARAQWQPSLNFATTQGFSNTPFADGNKNGYTSSYGFNAGWTVYDGGSREANIKRYNKQTEADKQTILNLERNLSTEILSLYLNILYAAENITICNDAATLSQAQADRAKSLMESGRLSRVDYAQLASQAEQDRNSVVNATATYDNQRLELKKLLELGLNYNMDITSYDWTQDQVLALPADLTDTYNLALAADAQMEKSRLETEIAELNVDVAKAGRYPTISLTAGVGSGYNTPANGVSWGTQMKKALSESVGLTLSVPILDNKKTKTAVSQANITRINSVLDQESRSNELAQAVEGWYIDLRSSQARYTAGLQRVEATQLTDDLVNEQFELGLVNPVELLQAHNDLQSARRELLQAKYMAMLSHKMIEYYRTTTITLP
jgi:outer membrane protein